MTIMAVATDLEEEVSVVEVEAETIETEITAVINRIRGGRITVEAAIKVEEGIRAEVEEAAITVDEVEVVNHTTEEGLHFMTEVEVVEEEVATMTEEAVEATDRKRTRWAFTEMIAQTPRWSKSSSTRMKCRQLVLTSTRYEIKFLLPSNLHSNL